MLSNIVETLKRGQWGWRAIDIICFAFRYDRPGYSEPKVSTAGFFDFFLKAEARFVLILRRSAVCLIWEGRVKRNWRWKILERLEKNWFLQWCMKGDRRWMEVKYYLSSIHPPSINQNRITLEGRWIRGNESVEDVEMICLSVFLSASLYLFRTPRTGTPDSWGRRKGDELIV